MVGKPARDSQLAVIVMQPAVKCAFCWKIHSRTLLSDFLSVTIILRASKQVRNSSEKS